MRICMLYPIECRLSFGLCYFSSKQPTFLAKCHPEIKQVQHLHFTPSYPDFALLSEYHQNSPRLLFGVLLLTAPAGEADNLQVDYLQKKCIEFLGKWSSVGGGRDG